MSPNVYYHEADARIKSRLFFAPEKKGRRYFATTRTQKSQLRKNNFLHDACVQLFKDEKNYKIERMQIYNASYGERERLKTTNQETLKGRPFGKARQVHK